MYTVDVYPYLEFYRRISGELTVGFWVVSIGPSGLYDCMFAGVSRPSKHFHGNTHSVVGFFPWFDDSVLRRVSDPQNGQSVFVCFLIGVR